jgi:hypothetical protein
MDFERRPEGDRIVFSPEEVALVRLTIAQSSGDPFSVEHLGKYRFVINELYMRSLMTLQEKIEAGVSSDNAESVFRLKSKINFFDTVIQDIDNYYALETADEEQELCPVISLGSMALRR